LEEEGYKTASITEGVAVAIATMDDAEKTVIASWFDDVWREPTEKLLNDVLYGPSGERYPINDLALFHYTTAAGFDGMLKSDEFWATRHDFLNDPSELVHAQSALRSVVEHWEAEHELPDTPAGRVQRSFLNKLGTISRSRTVDPCFVASFSTHSDALPMWREYADQGKGFAVAFRGKKLIEMAQASSHNARLLPVVYDAEFQQAMLGNWSASILNGLANLPVGLSKPGRILALLKVVTQVKAMWGTIAPVMKHPAYKSEAEFRLVTTPKFPKAPNAGVSTRLSNGLLVPFVKIPAGADGAKLPIKKVVAGPAQPQGVCLDAVRLRLVEAGQSLREHDVRQSKVPFRTAI